MPNQPVDTNVRNYYDQNTRRFLSYGTQKYTRTIHRAVWGPGVQDHTAALHIVHEKILNTIIQHAFDLDLSYLRVLDLGCGVSSILPLDELSNLACEAGFYQLGNHNLTQYLHGHSLPGCVTRMF